MYFCLVGNDNDKTSNLDDDTLKIYHEWLQKNIEPESTVISYWEATTTIRRENLKKQNLTAASYFELYPALKLSFGIKLVQKIKYPTYSNLVMPICKHINYNYSSIK